MVGSFEIFRELMVREFHSIRHRSDEDRPLARHCLPNENKSTGDIL